MVTCHLWSAPRLSAWASFYINDISSVISDSTVKLFADDITIYKEIICPADIDLLQYDLSKVIAWTAKTWMLRLNPDKCESIVLSNKRVPPVPHYYLNSLSLASLYVVRYLGIFVDCHLNRNSHCQHVAAKATRSLSTFFVTVYLIVLVRSNLLLINVLYDLLWSMLAQFGFPTPLRT